MPSPSSPAASTAPISRRSFDRGGERVGRRVDHAGHGRLRRHPPQRRLELGFADGGAIAADAVALCLGHFPPQFPAAVGAALASDPRAIRDPWRSESFAAVAPDDRVVIIGSGLTMADVAIELQDRAHRGPIVVVSRHGLLPNVHRRRRSGPRSSIRIVCRQRVSALFRLIRREAAKARRRGSTGARSSTACAPISFRCGGRSPLDEQMRALRHLRGLLGRASPSRRPGDRRTPFRVARRGPAHRRRWRAGGRAVDARGRRDRRPAARRRRIETLSADRVVNCTGPTTAFARIGRSADPRASEQGPGQAGPRRARARSHGRMRRRRCLGPSPRHPVRHRPPDARRVLEMLAVPELRRQAPETARRIFAALGVGAETLARARSAGDRGPPDRCATRNSESTLSRRCGAIFNAAHPGANWASACEWRQKVRFDTIVVALVY